MPSEKPEVGVWVETTQKELVNLAKFARIGVELCEDFDEEQPWAVVAFETASDVADVLATYAEEHEAREYYDQLTIKLQG